MNGSSDENDKMLYFMLTDQYFDVKLILVDGGEFQQNTYYGEHPLHQRSVMDTLWLHMTDTSLCLVEQPVKLCQMNYTGKDS